MEKSKTETSEDIKKINKRLVEISRAANKLLGENKSKENIKKLKKYCNKLNADVHELLEDMPKISSKDILDYLKSRAVKANCKTLVSCVLNREIKEHFEEYEQDTRALLRKLQESKSVFKNLYSYKSDQIVGDVNIIKQVSIYVFKESDLKSSYMIDGVIYTKVK